MKKAFTKIAAALSAVVLSAAPMSASAVSTKVGDSNGDGKLNMADVVNIIQWTTKYHNDINRPNSDINNDGVINKFDSKLLQCALSYNYDLENLEYDFGDADGNGSVNSRDYNIMMNLLQGGSEKIKVNGSYQNVNTAYVNSHLNVRIRFDVNGDGTFDWGDATDMMCYNYYDYFFNRDFTEKVWLGDANMSSPLNGPADVNVADVVIINRFINGDSVNINKENADVNKDGRVNRVDSRLVMRKCIECFDSFNIVFGDVDGNGVVTSNDYNRVRSYYGQEWNSRTISADLFNRCDANGDGEITSADRDSIRSFCNGNGFTE